MTHQYELMVILDPEIDERTVAPSLDKFLNVIRNDGGTIDKVDIWGRRRLAYEINKKTEGIYAVVNFTATREATKELDRQLKLSEAVMRTKVLRAEEADRPGRRGREARRRRRPPARRLRPLAVASRARLRGRQGRGSKRRVSAHGRRDRHHRRGQPHRRSRAALHAERAGGRELHHRIHSAHLRPRERTTGRTAKRCSSARASGASSPSTSPVR